MAEEFKYQAFISYYREDVKWARWLRNRLENYHIPNSLPQAEMKRRSLRRIFTDVNDLVAGSLSDVLSDSLRQSKYLIVICSPRAVQSRWVNQEIDAFIAMGRKEFIIPFVIDGAPFSNGAEECFPGALRELDILCVNVNNYGKNDAVARVVSRLLDVPFDSLRSSLQITRLLWPLKILAFPIVYLLKLCSKSEYKTIEEYTPKYDNTNIFISYRRIDGRDQARSIEQALLGAQYQGVFFDYTSIQDGRFNLKILDAIFSCKDFILILSPLSMKRCNRKGDWVAREIRTALKYDKHIIPVVLENSKGNNEWKWPRNFPKDLYQVKEWEQLPFQMGTYFQAAMNRLISRLQTTMIDEPSQINEDNDSCVCLKIKSPVRCLVYLDDELYGDCLEANKMKRIPLKKGEYIVKVTSENGEVLYEEQKIQLDSDRVLFAGDFVINPPV